MEAGIGGVSRSASVSDVALYLVGVAGMAASLTVLWLSMRAVMDIGGYCAEGGPYVIRQSCPEGVPILLVGSIFGLFVFGGLMLAKGAPLGGPYVGLVALAWPALFISLGWNFLEYAFRPPDGSSEVVIGWLIPGVLFMIMGGVPLLGAIRMAGTGSGQRSSPRWAPRVDFAERVARARDGAIGVSSPSAASSARSATDGSDLTSGLERLARLHRSGDLSDREYEDAKQAVIAEAARGG